MVALQRVLAYKRASKTYYRWQVILPSELIEQLGWPPGAELSATIRAGALTLRRA